MIQNKREGLTLVELLVVIAIIGILVGILVPATQVIRASARRTSCLNNIRQLMISTLDHEIVNGAFPKADNGLGGSLFIDLLPHLDEKSLFSRAEKEFENGETYADRLNALSSFPVRVLFCPATNDEIRVSNVPGHGKYSTDYFGIMGPVGEATSTDGTETYMYNALPQVLGTAGSISLEGMFAPNQNGEFRFSRGTKDALDGASNTLIYGEISRYAMSSLGGPIPRGSWAVGATFDTSEVVQEVYSAKSVEYSINSDEGIINNLSFASSHRGGAQFAFVDGSVKYISERISVDVLKAIASTNRLEQPVDLLGSD